MASRCLWQIVNLFFKAYNVGHVTLTQLQEIKQILADIQGMIRNKECPLEKLEELFFALSLFKHKLLLKINEIKSGMKAVLNHEGPTYFSCFKGQDSVDHFLAASQGLAARPDGRLVGSLAARPELAGRPEQGAAQECSCPVCQHLRQLLAEAEELVILTEETQKYIN
ncbi:agnoprotein [Rousettus leschenaultii polyomavirus 2]|nr:agnoprotein [Rousettus leschenaultii polyomavirus 2]